MTWRPRRWPPSRRRFPAPPASVAGGFKNAGASGHTAGGTLALSVPSTVVGDTLFAVIGGATIGVISPPAGWQLIARSTNATANQEIGLFGHQVAAGDPSTVTFTISTHVYGVILNYGAFTLPSTSAVTTINAGTQQAPSVPTWQNSQVVLEVWGSVTNSAVTISSNVNNPTTRASATTVDGSFLVVDYRQVAPTTATNGDTATIAAGSIDAVTLGIGA